MIQASVVNNTDIILTLEDHSAEAHFAGYQLERKSNSADWQPWNGSAWGGAAAALASNRFSDYGLSAGLYQYRFRVVFDDAGAISYSDYETSSWNRIASASTEKRGWSFENYTPPAGEFGEILTADDMRYTYLWGIPFTSSNGAQYTDAQIRDMIRKTVAEFEHVLNLTLIRRVIKCADDLAEGAVYDEAEDAYAYHRHNWNAGGRINTRRRPILSVERLELYTITQGKILDLMPWLRLDHKKGVIRFYPKVNANGIIKVFPAFLTYGYLTAPDYAHAYRIDYTAGFEDASKVPEDLRDVIGKAAACRLLNIIGDGLIAGFANMSLGMDGLSESFGTTASATNAMYGARINQYLKEIETWLKLNRNKFGSMVMGSI